MMMRAQKCLNKKVTGLKESRIREKRNFVRRLDYLIYCQLIYGRILISLWYQNRLIHVWSPTATHVPRHPIRVSHVFDLKIHHTWEDMWGCEGKKSHIGEKRNLVITYKRLSYFSYYQLIWWCNLNFFTYLLYNNLPFAPSDLKGAYWLILINFGFHQNTINLTCTRWS